MTNQSERKEVFLEFDSKLMRHPRLLAWSKGLVLTFAVTDVDGQRVPTKGGYFFVADLVADQHEIDFGSYVPGKKLIIPWVIERTWEVLKPKFEGARFWMAPFEHPDIENVSGYYLPKITSSCEDIRFCNETRTGSSGFVAEHHFLDR